MAWIYFDFILLMEHVVWCSINVLVEWSCMEMCMELIVVGFKIYINGENIRHAQVNNKRRTN
jgi:hypothetical protein